jgi:hypothetical protein
MAYFKAGILGFPGSGKTYTATLLAIGIGEAVKNKKVAYFDTETGSDFLLPMLRGKGFESFQVKSRSFTDLLETLKDCEKENIPILIIDSITHVWRDLCDAYDKKLQRRGRLQFQDWAIIKGEWKLYTDLFINSRIHIIACGRAGYEYDYDFNEDGTKDLIKTATRMKVESEFAFEPSLVIEMERTSEGREELKEHLGKTDRKSKEMKQTHKPTAGSKWIHRAYVLKDRTDTLNGEVFDYPVFDNFLPHFKALNIGGEQLGVDTTRTSEDRFNKEGKPQWKIIEEQKQIVLEEIKGEYEKNLPGSTDKVKKARVILAEKMFGTTSWTATEGKSLEDLRRGLKRMRVIFTVPENTPDNIALGKIAEPPDEDVQESLLEKHS